MIALLNEVALGILPLVPVWVWLFQIGKRLRAVERDNIKLMLLIGRLSEGQSALNKFFVSKIKQNDL